MKASCSSAEGPLPPKALFPLLPLRIWVGFGASCLGECLHGILRILSRFLFFLLWFFAALFSNLFFPWTSPLKRKTHLGTLDLRNELLLVGQVAFQPSRQTHGFSLLFQGKNNAEYVEYILQSPDVQALTVWWERIKSLIFLHCTFLLRQ